MLDKRSKIILNVLLEHNFTYPQSKFTSLEDTLIPLLPKSKKNLWNFESISPCIEYLIQNGYVQALEFYHGLYPVPDYKELYATYKGQNYKQFSRLQLRDELFRSVTLPIIVALITSIITAVSGYIWGMNSIAMRNPNIEPATEPIILDTIESNNK